MNTADELLKRALGYLPTLSGTYKDIQDYLERPKLTEEQKKALSEELCFHNHGDRLEQYAEHVLTSCARCGGSGCEQDANPSEQEPAIEVPQDIWVHLREGPITPADLIEAIKKAKDEPTKLAPPAHETHMAWCGQKPRIDWPPFNPSPAPRAEQESVAWRYQSVGSWAEKTHNIGEGDE